MINNLPIVLFVVIHFIISALLLLLFYFIVKKILNLLRTPLEKADNNPLNLFISFGIAVLLFQRVVFDTIYKLAKFFLSPIEKLKKLKSVFEDIKDFNDYSFSNLIFEWIRNLEDSFNDYILSIRFVNVIIFITFWLIISLLIKEIGKSIGDTKQSPQTNTNQYLTDNPILKNIFIILIVLFSIYLSIASIIAVPEFQIRESSQTETSLYATFSAELDSMKLYNKKNLMVSIDTSFPKSSTEPINNLIDLFKRTVADYNTEVQRNWTSDEKAKTTAVNRLKNAVDVKMTHNEGIEYKSELMDWYSSGHETWTKQSIYIQSGLLGIAEQIKRLIQTRKSEPDSADDGSNLQYRIDDINDNIWGIRQTLFAIQFSTSTGMVPNKPQIGEKFGIFRKISGWLLQTESASLALIVGLFGFGLLGSIGSTYIRQRIKETASANNDETLILADLQGIMINGISAAIVVFLAVKGTVLIFTNEGTELNPYVLFFGCLVASVFSEDVWSWARDKLRENLDRKKKIEEQKNADKHQNQQNGKT